MAYATAPDGARLWFTDYGPPADRARHPALVLAHGFTASSEMWWPQIATLTAHTRLVTWDARGHGRSDAVGPSGAGPDGAALDDARGTRMETLAADLRAVVEALDPTPAEPPVIAGMSFGGQIALQYAAQWPAAVGALVLSDVTTRGPELPDAEPPPAFAGHPGLANGYIAMMTRPDLTPELGRLTMPTLVIYGAEDPMIAPSVSRLTDGLPRRRVVALRDATHGSSAHRPEAWSAAVVDFLRDLDIGTPIEGTQER